MNRRKQNTMSSLTRTFLLVPALLSAVTLSLPSRAGATTFSTFHDSPFNISTVQPFATLNITESGSYLIVAKLDLVNDATQQHTLDCKLTVVNALASSDFDEAVIRLGANAFGATGGHLNGEMVFTVVHTFPGTFGNSANLSCHIDEVGAPIRARFIKITAIPVAAPISNVGF